ncbi:unnamed protein product [Callosobruchus maculatus]|uniref:Uncharacterized protein n=1 Tax=Callosobruchus maculatus TaxID=64391 RepID=A0A653BH92_CALMS|nr:unnamed protein product [Callosobruchus maculatus]
MTKVVQLYQNLLLVQRQQVLLLLHHSSAVLLLQILFPFPIQAHLPLQHHHPCHLESQPLLLPHLLYLLLLPSVLACHSNLLRM